MLVGHGGITSGISSLLHGLSDGIPGQARIYFEEATNAGMIYRTP